MDNEYGILTIYAYKTVQDFDGKVLTKRIVFERVSCTHQQRHGYIADWKGMNGEGFHYQWIVTIVR